MIEKRVEYEKMFAVEQELWWYRILHQRVLAAIEMNFSSKDIVILDAGCGTGGLLHALRTHGYGQVAGFDGSADAVSFCRQRGLDVVQHNLTQIENFVPSSMLDVIVCDDVFCYLTDEEIQNVVQCFKKWLKPNGIFISNNNAFSVFYGTHDIAIGSKRRFVKNDLVAIAQGVGWKVTFATYWSFILSPLILVIRRWQALKLKWGWEQPESIVSDVTLPPKWVNLLLYQMVQFEQRFLPKMPFGSSLFTVMR